MESTMYEEYPNKAACKYNQGVVCGFQTNCETCGWNPWVAASRSLKLREEQNGKGDKLGNEKA